MKPSLILLLLVCLCIDGKTQSSFNIEELTLYKVKNSSFLQTANIDSVKVDSCELKIFEKILSRASLKKNMIAKPSSLALYGYITINNQKAITRIDSGWITIRYKNCWHYIIKNKEDELWLINLLNKYNSSLGFNRESD